MDIINWTLLLVHVSLALAASGHALLNKGDPRSVWGWVSLCIVFPLLGSVLYFLFGINRVRTRARKMGILPSFRLYEGFGRLPAGIRATIHCSGVPDRWRNISNISDAITRLPLVDGNRIDILHNGEEAYPPMLAAIDEAEQSLYLTTYIFETNETGMRFIDALDRAQSRGVDVRVLLDGAGEMYSFPRAGTLLKRRGVRTVRFIPPTLKPPELHINLRNHRKIMLADRAVGFTGGMNIGDRHLADNLRNPSRIQDTHFRIEGPVLAQMEKAFLDDWAFATGEYAKPVAQVCEMAGGAICRTIVDGPNEDPEKLTFILAGAISSAKKSVLIMTPYFLPSREIVGAMQTAALRGVEVNVVLPMKNNLPFLQWATNNFLWKIMQWGVKIHFQPPPFAHSKILVVDDYYSQIGSANFDPRSLRLNFELNVEVFDKPTAAALNYHIRKVIGRSMELTLEDLDNRSFGAKFRDAFAWLFSPYL